MSETERLPGASETDDAPNAAAAQLEALNQLVEATFAEMGQSITEELSRVSVESRQSVRDMVDGILEDLARLAAEELVRQPLEQALTGAFRGRTGEAGANSVQSLLARGLRNG